MFCVCGQLFGMLTNGHGPEDRRDCSKADMREEGVERVSALTVRLSVSFGYADSYLECSRMARGPKDRWTTRRQTLRCAFFS